MAAPRKPLYFTFANHMHWVDMQWLWGYDVLPGSTRDMLALCAATGARGNVNFDAVGYEKMAAECPEALAELREAIARGTIEVVGASYGQPYGLFHGGESNIRQRVFGVRTVQRLLGVRPRAFWEEEFDFCPQLPQILKGCGFTGACLFFQWTWHTPHVPEEQVALIQWEGIDGTRLPTVPKNALCLHQWPEDFAGKLDSELIRSLPRPALVQWVELMPSPDWMCRSEVLLPRLRELFADERFAVEPVTLSALIQALDDGKAPVRRYTMDDVWHGMSLGKNGDHMPRLSHRAEERVLAAEAAASVASLLGRPYPSWDVYPTWELEEAWRELLQAQHHDNHECEGLCGFVGERSFERSLGLSSEVLHRTLDHLARRVAAPEGSTVVFNPLGWPRRLRALKDEDSFFEEVEVPAFGYRVVGHANAQRAHRAPAVTIDEPGAKELTVRAGGIAVTLDRPSGTITQLTSSEFPDGVLAPGSPLFQPSMLRDGAPVRFPQSGRWQISARPHQPAVEFFRAAMPSQLQFRLDLTESPAGLRVGSWAAIWSGPTPACTPAYAYASHRGS